VSSPGSPTHRILGFPANGRPSLAPTSCMGAYIIRIRHKWNNGGCLRKSLRTHQQEKQLAAPCSLYTVQPLHRAAFTPCSLYTVQPLHRAAFTPCSLYTVQPERRVARRPSRRNACRRHGKQPPASVGSRHGGQQGEWLAMMWVGPIEARHMHARGGQAVPGCQVRLLSLCCSSSVIGPYRACLRVCWRPL